METHCFVINTYRDTCGFVLLVSKTRWGVRVSPPVQAKKSEKRSTIDIWASLFFDLYLKSVTYTLFYSRFI